MSRKLFLIVASALLAAVLALPAQAQTPQPAPAGFDNKTNGFEDQAAFDKDRDTFQDVETVCPEDDPDKKGKPKKSRLRDTVLEIPCKADDEKPDGGGLGPVYNATSCVSCHQNPVTGSSSQIAEIRAGSHTKVQKTPQTPAGIVFNEPREGSLIHQRAIDARVQEHVPPPPPSCSSCGEEQVQTLRMSTNILGNGFVEVIQDDAILNVCKKQPEPMRGLPIGVPVAVRALGPDGEGKPQFEFVLRIGRFGWKAQEASLLNFSAGAYLNEMGITSPLQLDENQSNSGQDVRLFDPVIDPEDEAETDQSFGKDVEAFARFMRSTKVPPRDTRNHLGTVCVADPDKAKKVSPGEKLFHDLKCAVCHTPQYVTDAKDTKIQPIAPADASQGVDFNKGLVQEALASKIICPFSDFMLHDIGTGDGIAQTQHAQLPPKGAREFLQQLGVLRPQLLQTQQLDLAPQLKSGAKPSKKPAATEVLNCEITIGDGTDPAALDQRTVNKMRTAPLWGLRVRPQLMHDGLSASIEHAIRRHAGQADTSRKGFEKLSNHDKQQLLDFLNSL
jgi:CxxC motif-containing protein (DUF1111 family)